MYAIHAARAAARTRGESALTFVHTACTASRWWVARNTSRIAMVNASSPVAAASALPRLLAIEPLELVRRVALAIVVLALRLLGQRRDRVRLHLAEVAAALVAIDHRLVAERGVEHQLRGVDVLGRRERADRGVVGDHLAERRRVGAVERDAAPASQSSSSSAFCSLPVLRCGLR